MSSFLLISIGDVNYQAKVVSFSTSVKSSFTSVQTRQYMQHFPYKVSHDVLQLTLQMRNQTESRYFQQLVRYHHVLALGRNGETARFNWPQRGMDNWSGFISSVKAGEKVAVTSPTISISVVLVDSLTSQRTWASSQAPEFASIYDYLPELPTLEQLGALDRQSTYRLPGTVNEDFSNANDAMKRILEKRRRRKEN